ATSLTSSVDFMFSSRRRHTRFSRDWSSDVCSSDLCHINLMESGSECMAMRFQAIIRAVACVGIGLLLAGCAEDIGVDQYGRKVRSEERRVGKERQRDETQQHKTRKDNVNPFDDVTI